MELITPEHPLYQAEVTLRFHVLREPLGMTRSEVASPFEQESLHLVAVRRDAEVAGCVLFHPESATDGRLFQMAVGVRDQGAGLGRQLVRALESELMARGFSHVHLHARASAVGFYERLGYEVYDAPFVEVGIPHRHMRRTLGEAP